MPSQNLIFPSEDFSTGYTQQAGCVVSAGIAGPAASGPLSTSQLIDLTGCAVNQGIFIIKGSFGANGAASGKPSCGSVWVRAYSGTATINMSDPAGDVAAADTITFDDTKWTRISHVDPSAVSAGIWLRRDATGTAKFYAVGAQCDQSNAPGEYVQTTSAAVNIGAPSLKRRPQNVLAATRTLAGWTVTGGSVAVNQPGAPDGSSTAIKLTEDATTSNHRFYYAGSAADAAFTLRRKTASIYAKAGTRRWLYLTTNDAAGSIAYFDLVAGVVGTVGAGNNAQGRIQRVYDSSGSFTGWYRCSVSHDFVTAQYNWSFGLTSADNLPTGVGDGTGTLFLWHPQATSGSDEGEDASAVSPAQVTPAIANRRLPQNLVWPSRAIASAPWADDGTATRTNGFAAGPDGTAAAATRVQFAGGGAQYFYHPSVSYKAGLYTLSFWARGTSGPATIAARVKSGALNTDFTVSASIVLDTTWRRYSVTGSTSNSFIGTTGFVVIGIINVANAAADFLVSEMQLEVSNVPGDVVTTTTAAVDFGAHARTNVPQNSLSFSNTLSSWSAVNLSVTQNATGPDGVANSAWTITDTLDGSALGHDLVNPAGTGSAAGAVMTFSVYAKAGTKSKLGLCPAAAAFQVSFDLATGQVGQTLNQSTVISRCEPVVDITGSRTGWYRCSVTYVQQLATVGSSDRIYIAKDDLTSVAYQGTGTGTIQLWCAQNEQSDAPGIPLVTGASAVTGTGRPRNRPQQNLYLYPRTLNNAAWAKSSSSVTADVALGPDGTTSADRLTDTVASSVHAINQNVPGLVPGRIYTSSGYFKYENHPLILLTGNGGDGTSYVYFNIQTGVVASVLGANALSYSIVPVVDASGTSTGWYRCSNTFLANVNAGPVYYLAQSVGVLSYAGTGTDTMLMWGLQLEQTNAASAFVANDSPIYQNLAVAAFNPSGAPPRYRTAA